MSSKVRAAGGVVWRRVPAGIEVVLVHRPAYDDWALPKGKVEQRETDEEAALREVREETGLSCRLGPEPVSYTHLDVYKRQRFGRAVCLQVESGFSTEVLDLLIRELDLHPADVYKMDGLLDYSALWEIHDLDRPELKDEPFSPVTPSRLASPDDGNVDIFAAIAHEDIFVHHPYESFAMSTEAFVKQAARDPKVLAIKQTLYRTSGDSPVVTALIRAAERGKQVAALVEMCIRDRKISYPKT